MRIEPGLGYNELMEIEPAKEWMSPKRRFLSAILGGRVDRPAAGSVTSVANIEQMKLTGSWFPEAHLDPEKIARLAAAGHEAIGFDAVIPYFSVILEAASIGADVNWGRKVPIDGGYDITMPFIRPTGIDGRLWKEPGDVRVPEGWIDNPPTRALIDAISILRDRYRGSVAIVGKAMGPWTLCYHLIGSKYSETKSLTGTEYTLLLTRIGPGKLREFLEIFKELTIEFAREQARAGADLICIPDHATGDLVSPGVYYEYLHDLHREVNKRIGSPVVLHCCGATLDRMGYIAEEGFDAYHFESKNDPFEAKRIVAGRVSLIGNINNANTLLYGSEEDVMREAINALAAGVEVVGPDCAIPTRVSSRNLRVIVEVARRWPEIKDLVNITD